MKSNVDLYLNSTRDKVVQEGAEAAFLLVNAGRDIPDAELTALGAGILEQAMEIGQPAEETPAEPPSPEPDAKAAGKAEDKAVKAPAENKGKD